MRKELTENAGKGVSSLFLKVSSHMLLSAQLIFYHCNLITYNEKFNQEAE